ncbi:hypothetical protein EF405_17430 [Cyclobacteriaceae bacterium YHN15]|nr:hypothetical protein EF405_17430 [Cyclobacteriaceae bacterium YHN15]
MPLGAHWWPGSGSTLKGLNKFFPISYLAKILLKHLFWLKTFIFSFKNESKSKIKYMKYKKMHFYLFLFGYMKYNYIYL